MVGKLNLDLGDDYAFDIRRAREVAEGGGIEPPPLPGQLSPTPVGPYTSAYGAPYWLRKAPNAQVGFNIDTDAEPDVWSSLLDFLANEEVDQNYRSDVRAQALSLGWDGVS